MKIAFIFQTVETARGITTSEWKNRGTLWLPKTLRLLTHEEKASIIAQPGTCNVLTHAFVLMDGCQVI